MPLCRNLACPQTSRASKVRRGSPTFCMTSSWPLPPSARLKRLECKQELKARILTTLTPVASSARSTASSETSSTSFLSLEIICWQPLKPSSLCSSLGMDLGQAAMEWLLSGTMMLTSPFFGRRVTLFFFFLQTQLAITPTFNKLKKQLDREEDPWRRRRRLVRNYNGTTHPEATIGGRPMSPSIETPSTTGVDLSVAAHAVKFAAHIDHFDAPVTEVEIEEVGTKENSPCLSTNQAIPFFLTFSLL